MNLFERTIFNFILPCKSLHLIHIAPQQWRFFHFINFNMHAEPPDLIIALTFWQALTWMIAFFQTYAHTKTLISSVANIPVKSVLLQPTNRLYRIIRKIAKGVADWYKPILLKCQIPINFSISVSWISRKFRRIQPPRRLAPLSTTQFIYFCSNWPHFRRLRRRASTANITKALACRTRLIKPQKFAHFPSEHAIHRRSHPNRIHHAFVLYP